MFLSCGKPYISNEVDYKHISFKNIPNITKEEIKEIEVLQNEYNYFIYGMSLSTEAFQNERGNVSGYAALLCEWLSDVFGILFQPRLYDRLDLFKGLESGEINFTGEITPTAERSNMFHMTSNIALRPIKIFRIAGNKPLDEIAAERTLRYGFIEDSATIDIVTSELENVTYDIILLKDFNLVYNALKNGTIDAFYYSVTADANFLQYNDIVINDFYPLLYRPAALVTQNSKLKPIISVMEKLLESGALRYIVSLYNQGEKEYLNFKMYTCLNEEEREFIRNNPVIPIGVDPINYPSGFYDKHNKDWAGFSLDIINEISALTGLTFKRVNDENTGWTNIYNMLRNGEIALVPELTQSQEREDQFIWPKTVLMTDYYTLISDDSYRNIQDNEVLYVNIGLAKNTTSGSLFKKWFPNHKNTIEYETMEDAFNALQRGEIEMVMADQKRLLYLTHYLELPHYKANVVFDYAINVRFGLNKDQVILCSIIDKALGLINIKSLSDQWIRRTYNYRLKLAKTQLPLFIGSSFLLLSVLVLSLILLLKNRQTSKELERIVKKRTQELEFQTATLTTLFDSIPDIIYTKDLDMRFLQCNQTMIDHLKFRKEDVIGTHDLEAYGIPRETACIFDNLLTEVVNDGKIRTIEMPIPRYDGTSPVFEASHAPLISNGKTIGVIGILRDITKRKEMEEAALAASRSKSVFLANMSHEIRTPMNSIIGFAELALDDHISPRTRDYIRKILENAEGLLQIINDILDISKVESGKMELENIPFDLHELFTSCRMTIQPKANEKGIKLHFYAEPSLGTLPLGDPTRLRQVLVNLLSNAVKFTNKGIVKISATIENKTDKSITIHFAIKDSGIGMTKEQINKVFEPFTQAETGTTRKYGGTGLGLPISKNIIELMGGKLSVESNPGIGSKFCFTLTFNTIQIDSEDVVSAKVIRLKEIEKPYFNGEVLLCEDNLMNQQVICEHLSRVGLKTIIAENGRIAVDLVEERKKSGKKQFDIIFMDIYMPVMDGIEAASKIVKLDVGIPLIAMTANIMKNDREIYTDNGLRECIGKPFTSQELWRCLLNYFTPINIVKQNESAFNESVESDEEFLKTLKVLFVKFNKNIMADIKSAFETGDIMLAHRLVHTLKSNAGQINNIRVKSAASEVENRLKNDNSTSSESLIALEKELNIALNELSPLLNEEPKQRKNIKEKLDKAATQKLFFILEPLLKNGNPECLNYIYDIQAIEGDEELIEQLINSIKDFNFETALSLFYKLRNK